MAYHQRKHDRLFAPGSSVNETRCDMATAPFDEAVRGMDRKWGVDRLPGLVGPATAERWGLALANLNDALAAKDPALVVARVAACLRGLAVMDAEAVAAGHPLSDPTIREGEVEGFRFGIIDNPSEWPAAVAKRPDLQIFSMREVGVALAQARGVMPTVNAVKDAFPGAHITAVRSPLAVELNDDIPF